MLLYLEKHLHDNPQAKKIMACFKDFQVLEIDNYKNIFDKNVAWKTQKTIIIASVNNAILETPENYWFEGKSYFFKNSLNCVFNCSYCYLKGAFKNDFQVFFVNYEDIKRQIKETLEKENKASHNFLDLSFLRRQESINCQKILLKKCDSLAPSRFYSSDYSDNLATENITNFCEEFIPFFENIPDAMMEIRTKSTNIQHLLKFKNITHTEIAFSLNPKEIIEKYERGTPNLDARIQAANILIQAGWLVGIRFLPLLDVPNYQDIYKKFLDKVIQEIDFRKIHSIFVGWLMYTYEDHTKIQKKYPKLDILYKLHRDKDGFMREGREVRDYFYQLFSEKLWKQNCKICLDRGKI